MLLMAYSNWVMLGGSMLGTQKQLPTNLLNKCAQTVNHLVRDFKNFPLFVAWNVQNKCIADDWWI